MTHLSTESGPPRILLVLAAPAEARAVRSALGLPEPESARSWSLEPGPGLVDLIESGVGKAQAAAACAWAFHPARHRGVISLGIAGALPGSGLMITQIVLASRSRFADEGIATPAGFRALDTLGFPPAAFDPAGAEPDPAWRARLAPLADRVGPIATVSTCSSRDDLAHEIARRTGAVAEAMEGAAVAAALSRLPGSPPCFAEIRVVSNTTGDRDRQTWDLPRALDRLAGLTRQIASCLGSEGRGSADLGVEGSSASGARS
jgi:futalosine hydrolase